MRYYNEDFSILLKGKIIYKFLRYDVNLRTRNEELRQKNKIYILLCVIMS